MFVRPTGTVWPGAITFSLRAARATETLKVEHGWKPSPSAVFDSESKEHAPSKSRRQPLSRNWAQGPAPLCAEPSCRRPSRYRHRRSSGKPVPSTDPSEPHAATVTLRECPPGEPKIAVFLQLRQPGG